MEAQQYGQEANKAQAQNAIDRFNAETQQATNMYNVGTANQAQAANLNMAQDIASKNTETAQKQALYNAQQYQQDYANKMTKAQNLAHAYQTKAGAANTAAQAAQGAELGLISGIIGAGTQAASYAMGAPGGAATPTTGSATLRSGAVVPTYKPTAAQMGYPMFEGGEVKDEDKMIEFPKDEMIEEHERLIPQLEGDEKEKQSKELDEIRDMTDGGFVPGKAKVKGDSLQNDVVPAILSPGEIVVPRSAANDEEDYNKFMKEVRFQPMNCGGKAGYATGGPVPPPNVPLSPPKPPPVMEPLPTEAAPKVPTAPSVEPAAKDDTIERALKSLQFRVTNLEGGK